MTLREISEEFGIYYGTLLNWKKNKKKLVDFLQTFSKDEIEKILNKKENNNDIIIELNTQDVCKILTEKKISLSKQDKKIILKLQK